MPRSGRGLEPSGLDPTEDDDVVWRRGFRSVSEDLSRNLNGRGSSILHSQSARLAKKEGQRVRGSSLTSGEMGMVTANKGGFANDLLASEKGERKESGDGSSGDGNDDDDGLSPNSGWESRRIEARSRSVGGTETSDRRGVGGASVEMWIPPGSVTSGSSVPAGGSEQGAGSLRVKVQRRVC